MQNINDNVSLVYQSIVNYANTLVVVVIRPCTSSPPRRPPDVGANDDGCGDADDDDDGYGVDYCCCCWRMGFQRPSQLNSNGRHRHWHAWTTNDDWRWPKDCDGCRADGSYDGWWMTWGRAKGATVCQPNRRVAPRVECSVDSFCAANWRAREIFFGNRNEWQFRWCV